MRARLRGTTALPVRIAVVDKSDDFLDAAVGSPRGHGLYDVRGARTIGEGRRLLREHAPHVCLTDLCMRPDPFALVREFGARSSFVVVSSSGSIEDGFVCRELGVLRVLRKPSSMVSRTITDAIRVGFEENRFRPSAARVSGGFRADLCDALLGTAPRSVGHWAQRLGVTEAYVRKGCAAVYGRSAGCVLNEFTTCREALRRADDGFLGREAGEVGFALAVEPAGGGPRRRRE